MMPVAEPIVVSVWGEGTNFIGVSELGSESRGSLTNSVQSQR
jgi:hypothetical protein